jgi:hypothetical protein
MRLMLGQRAAAGSGKYSFNLNTYPRAVRRATRSVRSSLICENLTMTPEPACPHILEIETVKLPDARVCEECVNIRARWLHLRTCQTCRVTLCCDSSPNQHASKHARATAHPVIASAEPGERWLYCYPDEAFAEY